MLAGVRGEGSGAGTGEGSTEGEGSAGGCGAGVGGGAGFGLGFFFGGGEGGDGGFGGLDFGGAPSRATAFGWGDSDAPDEPPLPSDTSGGAASWKPSETPSVPSDGPDVPPPPVAPAACDPGPPAADPLPGTAGAKTRVCPTGEGAVRASGPAAP